MERIAYQCFSTGEYAGPMETYDDLLPNGATWDEPPAEKDGYALFYKNGAWEYVEDHRGQSGYINGELTTISEVGPLPKGWSTEPPEPTEDEKNLLRIDAIKNELQTIDMQTTRPLRAILANTGTDEDKTKLIELETQAKQLRIELASLSNTTTQEIEYSVK